MEFSIRRAVGMSVGPNIARLEGVERRGASNGVIAEFKARYGRRPSPSSIIVVGIDVESGARVVVFEAANTSRMAQNGEPPIVPIANKFEAIDGIGDAFGRFARLVRKRIVPRRAVE